LRSFALDRAWHFPLLASVILLRSLRRLMGAAALLVWGLGLVAPSLADGALERAARNSVAHVEGQGSTSSHVAHDHQACQLCQLLHGAPVAARGAELPDVARRIAPPVAWGAVPVGTSLARVASARAPPVV
jgi:hypothetical protein